MRPAPTSRARCRIVHPGGAPPRAPGLSARQCWRRRSRPTCCSALSNRRMIWPPMHRALGCRGSGGGGHHAPAGILARLSARGVAHRFSFAETSGTYVNVGRALAKLGGRSETAGRKPAGMEGVARAGEPLEPARHRLCQCGRGSRCAQGAVRHAHRGGEQRDRRRRRCGDRRPAGESPTGAWVEIPPYQGDALVRGSEALSKTKDGRMARAVI